MCVSLLCTPSPSNTAGESGCATFVRFFLFGFLVGLGQPSSGMVWENYGIAALLGTNHSCRPHKKKDICQQKNCRSKWIATKALLELCHLIRSVEVRLKLVPKIQGLVLAHLSQDCQPGQWWLQVKGLKTIWCLFFPTYSHCIPIPVEW